jgi:hypothetical protein
MLCWSLLSVFYTCWRLEVSVIEEHTENLTLARRVAGSDGEEAPEEERERDEEKPKKRKYTRRKVVEEEEEPEPQAGQEAMWKVVLQADLHAALNFLKRMAVPRSPDAIVRPTLPSYASARATLLLVRERVRLPSISTLYSLRRTIVSGN